MTGGDASVTPISRIVVRPYCAADHAEWLRMRLALWPDIAERDSPELDAAMWIQRPDAAVLVAERYNCIQLAGFIEIGHREYADGCDTSPVAYLEGWYVDPDLRGQGIGAALIRAAEILAREWGDRELASDALLENLPSQRAHVALGFEEIERSIKYRKRL